MVVLILSRPSLMEKTFILQNKPSIPMVIRSLFFFKNCCLKYAPGHCPGVLLGKTFAPEHVRAWSRVVSLLKVLDALLDSFSVVA